MTLPRSELVTYALCAAAIGMGVYVVVDRGTPTTREYAQRAGMLLRVWRPDDVTRVTVQRRNGEKVELVREGEQWKLTSPRSARADFIAVSSLLNALGGARAERAVGSAAAADRKQFGLDSPRATVEVSMKGLTLKLTLGGPATEGAHDAGGEAYLEVAPNGDDKGGVYVVGADLARAIDRDADAYREASLLASQQSPTFTRITVRTPAGGVILERAPHGSFRIPSGVDHAPVRADGDAVNGLFAVFGELKADPFVDDATPVDESKGGALDIDVRDGSKLSLVYGGPCPSNPKQVVVQLRIPTKITGCVASVITDRLSSPATHYVDGHAFGLLFGTENAKISEIESVVVERDGKRIIDAERRADGLHLRLPSDEQIDKEATERFLRRLAATHGLVTVLPTPPPTFVGKVTVRRRVDPITLGPANTNADGGADLWDQIVEVTAPVEEGTSATKQKVVYLRRSDDGAILRAAAEDADVLGPSAARDLRNANLVDLPSDAITSVATHTTSASAVPFELSRVSGVLRLLEPPLGADPTAASDLLLHLATLSCTRWAADKDDGTFGFDKPTATLVVHRDPTKGSLVADAGEPPVSEIVIELGSPSADGGVYARVKGRDAVCVLPEAKRDALLRVPIDRAAVGFDASVTPRIVLTRGNAMRALQFTEAKSWRDGSDAGAGGNDAVARKLADLVVSLRAEGLVHLGTAGKDEGFGKPTLTAEGYDGPSRKKRVVIGALGKLDRATVYFVRVDGIEATYAVLREDVDRILTSM